MAEPPSTSSSPPGSRSGPPQAPPSGAGDPSMEDILASIRRILNEDEPAADADRPAQPPEDEPLDLTREMLVGAPPAAAPPAVPASAVSSPAPAAPTPPPVASAQSPPPAETPSLPTPANVPAAAPPDASPVPPASGALLAPAVAAAASASVGQLLRAVAAERGSAVRGGGPTIEDVVREELRPMLKDWLDQHLPAVVERLVRAEIERVVGRALS